MESFEMLVELAGRGVYEFLTIAILLIAAVALMYIFYRIIRDFQAFWLEKHYSEWELQGDSEEIRKEDQKERWDT